MDQLSPKIKSDDWTVEDQKTLVELYNKGYSMGDIGNRFNRTRNAVAGQIFKIRKKGMWKIESKRITLERVKSMVPVKSKTGLKLVKPEVKKKRIRLKMIDDASAVTFAELEQHHCRWPLGDPRLSDFRFCGCARVSMSQRTPYCAAHTTVAGRHYELSLKDAARNSERTAP